MLQRKIGSDSVGAIGLGCMGMSQSYGPADESESIAVLNRALELGATHWDTADMYGSGANERLLAKVLKSRRSEVFLATKFGNVFDRSMTSHQDLVAENVDWIVDGTPEYARRCIEASLSRLGVECVDLYYLHRIDARVPIEETIGAMAKLAQEGKTRYLGISEASAETVRRAHAVHPLGAVQNEFSLWTRDYERTVAPLCAELGVAFVPFSPLGRGFLTGAIKTNASFAEDDVRRANPRFLEGAFDQNLSIVRIVERIAAAKGVAPAQIALAWILAKGEQFAPIPGTKRLKYLEQNAGAAEIRLASEEIDELDGVPNRWGRAIRKGRWPSSTAKAA